MSSTQEQSKKRTRRRLRVSCVECTRRRQKCDRQQPCSSCVSRGVERLCRWELEPFARPMPARPPGHSSATGSQGPSRRAATNNHSPEPPDSQNATRSEEFPSPPTAQRSLSSLSEPDLRRSSPNPLDQDVKDAAITLAQLSVAHRGEYMGAGSLLGDPDVTRTTWQISNEVPHSSQVSPTPTLNVNLTNSFRSAIRALIASLPNKEVCDILFSNFMKYQNWRFTLPKDILSSSYKHMWEILNDDSASGTERVNIHWLTLLYAIFALSPTVTPISPIPNEEPPVIGDIERERRTFFLHSLSGRRIAEDLLGLSSSVASAPPTVTEGASYGCLAVILLVHYMCDRGNVSEAWKMIGSAIRLGQAIGLHRDPDLYATYAQISQEEQKLRKITWWLLVIQDRFLSFMLGRPVIVRLCDTDVPLPNAPTSSVALEGADVDLLYHSYMAGLSCVLAECMEECFTLKPTPPSTYTNAESKFEDWGDKLPSFFSPQGADTTYDRTHPLLKLQRTMLAIHYYHSRMIFYRHLDSKSRTSRIKDNPNKDKHILMALNLLRAERDMLAYIKNHEFSSYVIVKQPCFETTFCVFDSAVTLCIGILQDPNSPYVDKWASDVKDAVSLLESVKDSDSGDIVRQALRVLLVLQEACKPAMASPNQRSGSNSKPADANIILNPTPPSIEDILAVQDTGFNLVPDGFNNGWTGFALLHNFQPNSQSAHRS